MSAKIVLIFAEVVADFFPRKIRNFVNFFNIVAFSRNGGPHFVSTRGKSQIMEKSKES
jgi:hypothetical protein